MIRERGINESRRLLTIYFIIEVFTEKNIFNIDLMDANFEKGQEKNTSHGDGGLTIGL
jgi:hypothetical protein